MARINSNCDESIISHLFIMRQAKSDKGEKTPLLTKNRTEIAEFRGKMTPISAESP
jgi:hypothetical protein